MGTLCGQCHKLAAQAFAFESTGRTQWAAPQLRHHDDPGPRQFRKSERSYLRQHDEGVQTSPPFAWDLVKQFATISEPQKRKFFQCVRRRSSQ